MRSCIPEGKAVPAPRMVTVVMTNRAHPFTFDDLKGGIKSDLKEAKNK